jgi:hypothetical protein
MRKLFVFGWLTILMCGVGALFWYNELQYQLPTPVPQNYKAVNVGQRIAINQNLKTDSSKPLFLHFFNPNCPCSRFNIKMFKSLVSEYGRRVNFGIVVMSNKTYSVKDIQDKFNLNVPVSFDKGLAQACGVYSTPQVALLDKEGKLYYRGNYNRSRYCTDEKTNYAKQAVTGLLNDHSRVLFSKIALTSYGCRLPNCNK